VLNPSPQAGFPPLPIRHEQPISAWKRRFGRFDYCRRRVPRRSVFVVGDNAGSLDSRHYGPVPEGHVLGRVLMRRAPFPADCPNLAVWAEPLNGGRAHASGPGALTAELGLAADTPSAPAAFTGGMVRLRVCPVGPGFPRR
jgi:hypothetical protein